MLKKLVLVLGIILTSIVSYSEEKLLLLEKNNLIQIKEKIDKKDSFVMPAFNELLLNAEEALKEERITVVDKNIVPPSKDKHDYMSFGPYWWPNPDTPDGYPYIQKDGKVNPASKTDSDSPRLVKLARQVETLSLAYYYTSDIKYATHAVKLVKMWFLDKDTKMNPNLRYGQAIPGKVDGRAIGIIDSRHFIRILDSITLLEDSKLMSKKELKNIRKWIEDFNLWLIKGEYSYEESNWPNNHGTYYDYQVAGYHIYSNQLEEAKEVVKKSQYIRLASHIGSKGQNFHELERTRPLHYSIFDLEALVALALYGDKFEDIDFWNFTANKASLKNAIDYIVKYKNNPDMWLVKKEKVKFDSFAAILLIASQKYNTDEYKSEIKKLWKENPTNLNYLKWNINM